jgi:hypothetical protein
VRQMSTAMFAACGRHLRRRSSNRGQQPLLCDRQLDGIDCNMVTATCRGGKQHTPPIDTVVIYWISEFD